MRTCTPEETALAISLLREKSSASNAKVSLADGSGSATACVLASRTSAATARSGRVPQLHLFIIPQHCMCSSDFALQREYSLLCSTRLSLCTGFPRGPLLLCWHGRVSSHTILHLHQYQCICSLGTGEAQGHEAKKLACGKWEAKAWTEKRERRRAGDADAEEQHHGPNPFAHCSIPKEAMLMVSECSHSGAQRG